MEENSIDPIVQFSMRPGYVHLQVGQHSIWDAIDGTAVEECHIFAQTPEFAITAMQKAIAVLESHAAQLSESGMAQQLNKDMANWYGI